MQKKSFLPVLTLGILSACPAVADTVNLENGDRLSGTVEGFDGTTLTLKADYAGTVKLPAESIAGVATDEPVTVRIDGVGWATGRLTTDEGGAIRVVRDDGTDSAPVALTAINRLHPGRDVPLGFQWRGRVNAGATERSGNTDNRSIHLDTEVVGRAEEDRVKLRGRFDRELDNDGERTVDSFLASAQHDHFFSEKMYFYTSGKFERDMPADLNLRTTLGTGLGYQFFETETTKLSFRVGPAYVNENFETAEDSDYLAITWGVDFDQIIWDSVAELFHYHEGTVEAGDAGNYMIISSTGIRFPFGNGLNATAQIDIDYDNQPAPGVSSTDKRYLMTIGYAW